MTLNRIVLKGNGLIPKKGTPEKQELTVIINSENVDR